MYTRRQVTDHVTKMNKDLYDNLQDGIDEAKSSIEEQILVIEKLKEDVKTFNPYPVGAVYISFADTDPSELFGGTWEPIEGRFLLAASSDYEVGSTGGEATHKLTVAEMPSHTHHK